MDMDHLPSLIPAALTLIAKMTVPTAATVNHSAFFIYSSSVQYAYRKRSHKVRPLQTINPEFRG